MNEYILEMYNVKKYFPGVKALDNVDFKLKKGEVHAILGENGAGKSTLIKILTGIHSIDGGKILIKGEEVKIKSVNDAHEHHIAAIHQELCLVPYITVARNIYLGREVKSKMGTMKDRQMDEEAQRLLDSLGLEINASELVASYSIAHQQLVEIAKAISLNAEILIMDEPTSSLSETEVNLLFETISRLKAKGTSIIYISHRMDELFAISDSVTVLRDGKYIGTKETVKTTQEELVTMMVGRSLDQFYTKDSYPQEEINLRVKNLSREGFFKEINLDVRRGEILGVSGMVGSGRTEMARAIFGIDTADTGEIWVGDKKLPARHKPKDAINAGIALIPENRKEQGLVLINTLRFNITLGIIKRFIKGFVWKKKVEEAEANKSAKALNIKATGLDQLVNNLSGGNQQKVVIAKWLAQNPKVLIMDEPTRGVDIGAKAEIYDIMNQLAKAGVSIIMISSELPEIINMSDRVAVFRKGSVMGILDKDDVSQAKIISFAI